MVIYIYIYSHFAQKSSQLPPKKSYGLCHNSDGSKRARIDFGLSNYGDFSNETGLSLGDVVEITMAEKAGMTESDILALKNNLR